MCAREADPKGAQAALLGIYTLTPTHCGTGKAMDAVDLPIAREGHTRHPVLPSSSIKGALRAAGERALNTSNGKDPRIADWFGPEIKKPGEGGTEQDMAAGSVIFTTIRPALSTAT